MRPTRYCAKCGEYVDDKPRTIVVNDRPGPTRMTLVHVSADGNEIHRAHKPVEAK